MPHYATYLPPSQPQEKEEDRFPRAHVHLGWPRRDQAPPRQGPAHAPDGLGLTAPSRRFRGEAKLGRREDFQRVFQGGRKTPGRSFIVWSVAREAPGPARLGLSVSAKVGTAPRRNRLKRLTRETFRLNRSRLVAADLVVNLRPGCAWRSRTEAERDLLDAWRRAGLLQ